MRDRQDAVNDVDDASVEFDVLGRSVQNPVYRIERMLTAVFTVEFWRRPEKKVTLPPSRMASTRWPPVMSEKAGSVRRDGRKLPAAVTAEAG